MAVTTFEGFFPTQSGDLGVVTAVALSQSVNQAAGVIVDNIFAAGSALYSEAGIVPIAGGYRLQGQAAGDGFDYPWGLWGSYQYSDFDDDFATSAFDANRHGVYLGADFTPWDNWVFGAMLGFEDVNTNTTFNGGEIDSNGFTIAPYMGVQLSESVDVDFDLSAMFAFGYSRLDHDQFRTIGATRITSDTTSDRVFFSGNVVAGNTYGNWYISGQVGVLVAQEDVDGYTESNGTVVADDKIELGQVNIGGEAAYAWGSFEPFASALYSHDYNREELSGGHPNDQNELNLGLGIRYFSEGGISASAEYTKSLLRDNFDSDSITLTIRADF